MRSQQDMGFRRLRLCGIAVLVPSKNVISRRRHRKGWFLPPTMPSHIMPSWLRFISSNSDAYLDDGCDNKSRILIITLSAEAPTSSSVLQIVHFEWVDIVLVGMNIVLAWVEVILAGIDIVLAGIDFVFARVGIVFVLLTPQRYRDTKLEGNRRPLSHLVRAAGIWEPGARWNWLRYEISNK